MYRAVTQEDVDRVTKMFAEKSSIPAGDYSKDNWRFLGDANNPVSSWFQVGFNTSKLLPPSFSDLASTTKVVIDYIVAGYVDKSSFTYIPISAETLIELFERAFHYAKNQALYKRFLDMEDIIFLEEAGEITDSEREKLLAKIRKMLIKEPLMVPIAELRYQMLVLSSNYATTQLKEWVESQVGGPEAMQKMIRALLPSATITRTTTDGHHWIQEGGAPNTGSIFEIASFLHKKAMASTTKGWETQWLDQLNNNLIEFGFGITTSVHGQLLRKHGITIREKTGYQICYWQPALAQIGLPMHMNMCSVIQLIPRAKTHLPIATIGMLLRSELSQPTEMRGYARMPKGVKFPDVTTPEYREYKKNIFTQMALIFRDRFGQLIHENNIRLW